MKIRSGLFFAALLIAPSLSGAQAEEKAAQAPKKYTLPQSLEESIAGAWRPDSDVVRDKYRHPAETLHFFKIKPQWRVAEIWPSSGYYTQILAPRFLVEGGTYIAVQNDLTSTNERTQKFIAGYKERFADKSLYGEIEYADLKPNDPDGIAPPGSLDAVLTFRNVHNWRALNYADEAFASFYAALKPGGVLGVVEHRLPENMSDASATKDPGRGADLGSGYLHVSEVKALAKKAGFEFVAESEINANPLDTHDHPFGVWTLPPVRRSAPQGQEPDPNFDHTKYDAIGESDRMTLLFRKPKK